MTGPSPAVTSVIAASVALDAATGKIATFTPQSALAAGMYSVKIVGGVNGVKDLAVPPDDMLSNATWTFTAGAATGACQPPVVLGSVSPFGDVAGVAGMTNTGTLTQINGNLGTTATVTSAITGFHDTAGDVYTETPANIGAVNGTIYSCTNSTTGPTIRRECAQLPHREIGPWPMPKQRTYGYGGLAARGSSRRQSRRESRSHPGFTRPRQAS